MLCQKFVKLNLRSSKKHKATLLLSQKIAAAKKKALYGYQPNIYIYF